MKNSGNFYIVFSVVVLDVVLLWLCAMVQLAHESLTTSLTNVSQGGMALALAGQPEPCPKPAPCPRPCPLVSILPLSIFLSQNVIWLYSV